MRNDIGAILAWKYKHAEGMVTVDGKIKEWPSYLGTKPTEQQIELLGKDYDEYVIAQKKLETEKEKADEDEIASAFPDKAQQKIIKRLLKGK